LAEPIYLTPDELVARFKGRVTKKTLSNWRVTGEGPDFKRFGSRILYSLSSVEKYEGEREFSSSGEHKQRTREQRKAKQATGTKPRSQRRAAESSVGSASLAPATTGSARLEAPELHGACKYCQPTSSHNAFEGIREAGLDTTDGRYAEVSILRCRSCEALWVRYHVEYEAFSGSGRWARGLIGEELAAAIEPREVAAYLAGLPSYAYGGSYFGHAGSVRTGAMHWGP
jgi:hypothetical protein